MIQPSLAVLVPVYNCGRYLRTALDSVFAQTSRPDEIIIVDNASTDDTYAIAREYAGELGVRVERNSANLGGPRNWAIAAELAESDYLSWLPGDDVLLPHFVAGWRDAVAQHREPSLFIAGFRLIDEAGRPMPSRKRPPLKTGLQPGATLIDWMVRYGQPNMVAGTVFRRSDYEAVGGIDLLLRGTIDFDLFLRLAGRTPVYIDAGANAAVREHADQWSKEMLADDNGDMEVLFDKAPSYGFLTKWQARRFVGGLCNFSRQYYMRLLLKPGVDVALIRQRRRQIRERLLRWQQSDNAFAKYVRVWPRKPHSWAAWLAGATRLGTWALHAMLSRRAAG